MKDNHTKNNEALNQEAEEKKARMMEFIREETLKLIPDDFNEEDLKRLIKLIQMMGNLSPEEREDLFKRHREMSPEEIVEILEGKRK